MKIQDIDRKSQCDRTMHCPKCGALHLFGFDPVTEKKKVRKK